MKGRMDETLPHIVVVGAGFAGLRFVRNFPETLARITIVDRQNHHLFQPLLYQVATAGLSAVDIAQPIRALFADRPNLAVVMGEVTAIDLAKKQVRHHRGELSYDYLVLAAGGTTNYFGHPEWEQFAPGLKTLDDALRIRRLILCALESAETETDPAKREAAMTIVVIGGGPTGVEMAGALAELTRVVVHRDFDKIDTTHARVILIEGSDHILSPFPPELRESALQQLMKLGVEVKLGRRVEDVRDGELVANGEVIRANSIIWGAGVGGAPIARTLGLELDRAGRIKVRPDCSVPGHPTVFALGDMISLTDAKGVLVPGVAQGAMQMGKYVANLIENELRGPAVTPAPRAPFVYNDKGTMATIGRASAVAMVKKFKLRGFPAWFAWLAVHLMFLVGFRNRFSVLMQWMYSYFTYKRGARIITGVSGEKSACSA